MTVMIPLLFVDAFLSPNNDNWGYGDTTTQAAEGTPGPAQHLEPVRARHTRAAGAQPQGTGSVRTGDQGSAQGDVTRPAFDCEALYLAMDKQRRDRRLSWRAVGREVGVPNQPSLMTRLAHGKPPGVANLVLMLAWLGTTDLEAFIAAKGGSDG